MLEVEYSNQAKKFLKQSENVLSKRLIEKIEKLQEQPITPDTKLVEGYKEKTYRVRVGDYRILYEIDYENDKIGIIKIDKRSKVYE